MGRVYLTKQQARVLYLLSQGLTTRQIAQEMKLSERTVYAHILGLKQRLRAISRAQILLFAARYCPNYLKEESQP